MGTHHIQNGFHARNGTYYQRAHVRMTLHYFEFFLGEAPGLSENIIRNGDLSDIMEQSANAYNPHGFVRKA